jgi:hypothetical protein
MIIFAVLFSIGLVIMIPGIIKTTKKRRKQLALAQSYDRLVLKNKLSVEETLVFNNRVIGLDRKNRKLLLIDHNKNVMQEQCVALDQLESGQLVRLKDEAKKCTIGLFLELKYKSKDGSLRFMFFDETKDNIVEKPGLVKKAQYWKRKIDMHRKADRISPGFEFMF